MTKNLGFSGGGLINVLGSKEDILAFFKVIDEWVVKHHPKTDWSLITDRFYKTLFKVGRTRSCG